MRSNDIVIIDRDLTVTAASDLLRHRKRPLGLPQPGIPPHTRGASGLPLCQDAALAAGAVTRGGTRRPLGR